MTALVLDASALVAALLNQESAPAVRAALRSAGGAIAAPEILDLEVVNALRRHLLAGRLDEARARRSIEELTAAQITRWGHEPLLPRIWQLRDNLTAYDAAYVALAEVLGAPLLTLDRSLAAAPGHSAKVEVV